MVRKMSDITRFLLVFLVIVIVGFLLSFKFFKLDVTEEKRHSLTETTIATLKELEEQIFFKVYLTGDLPAEYKKLENAIAEKLDEFRDYSDDAIDYEFVNPYVSEEENENKKFWEKLYDAGIKFTRRSLKDDEARKEKIIFHGALMNIDGVDYPINFLRSYNKNTNALEVESMINSSITNLEYELISKISQHTRNTRPRVGILDGHGELGDINLASIANSLKEFYDLERVYLDERIDAVSEKFAQGNGRNLLYDALIVPKPTQPFSIKDQFILDQYVMYGGKILWFLDAMAADMDSLVTQDQALSLPLDLGLSNMLFDYGARVNNDLVIDLNAIFIPMDVGPLGDGRNIQPVPWYYMPRLVVDSNLAPFHPINKNLHSLVSEFVSSIDTIENNGIDKTVLLTTSKESRRLKPPVRINLNLAQFGPEYFSNPATLDSYSPVAVLLEGEFQSTFKNRGIQDTIRNSSEIAFREKSKPTSMIVVSDGDMIRNDIFPGKEGYEPLPLGFDQMQRGVAFDNTEFIMNCMNYLLDDKAVISLRTRTFKSRLLSVAKLTENKTLIKFINVILPILLIGLLGLIMFFIRRSRYAKKMTS